MPFKRYLFTRTDTTVANAVTITPNGADSIKGGSLGTSITLQTQNELVEMISDNVSNWIIVQRYVTTPWTAYTPTFSAGFGTTSGVSFFWRRVGDSVEVSGYFKCGTVAASVATITIPNSATWTIDTTKVPGTAHNQNTVGTYTTTGAGTQNPWTTTNANWVIVDTKSPTANAVALTTSEGNDGAADVFTVMNVTSFFNSLSQGTIRFTVPITNFTT